VSAVGLQNPGEQTVMKQTGNSSQCSEPEEAHGHAVAGQTTQRTPAVYFPVVAV